MNARDEVILTTGGAKIIGAHVGESLPLGLYSPAQTALPGFGIPRIRPLVLIHVTVVGLVDINTQVLQDDVDQTYGFMFVTPVLVHQLIVTVHQHVSPALYGVQLTKNAHRSLRLNRHSSAPFRGGTRTNFT